MSFSYYRKEKARAPPNTYGFKQVSPKELGDIMKRVTRPTYSAKVHTEDQRKVNNYEHVLAESGRKRVASACSCRKEGTTSRNSVPSRMSEMSGLSGGLSAASDTDNEIKPRRLTEWQLNRLLRRLQRPTETFTAATAQTQYRDELLDQLKRGRIVRPRTADNETAKKVEKLRRPTTATLAKELGNCHLCYEHENKKSEEPDAFDYDYCIKKVVPAEEMDYIVGRLATPTFASKAGRINCGRLPPQLDEVKIRQSVPLVSGLSRSKNVKEITERLCPRRYHGHIPHATPVMVF